MYQNNSDEENIRLIREENDNAAMEYLIKKYMGVVKKESRTLYLIGAENEDILQEGMIGLFKAIRDYNPQKGASFSTFANICVKRQLITAVKQSNRKKHSPLNSYISFYSTDDTENFMLNELVADKNTEPEMMVLGNDKSEKIDEFIDKNLSKYEKSVLTEYLSGKTYEEIGANLSKTPKSIDNAVQRIRKKLKSIDEQ